MKQDVPRSLAVVINDRESETRTPAQPLRPIPPAARDPFSAQPPRMEWGGPPHLDLSRIAPGRPVAQGEVIDVVGQILDEDARPVAQALVEIWNCNSFGRYSHVADHSPDAPLDPHFRGFGRLMTDADGRYRLRTIRPAGYLARADIGWWRPPHIHFSILGNGPRLVTQMYFPGEPLNEKDPIHLIIPPEERPRAIARSEGGVLRWDIVMRGRHQSHFEDDHD
jgi:protocatechuate 3,4-dioxygenase beta subunit